MLITDPVLMTPEQRASFEMFGFAEYRPYWPDVRLKQRDGSMKSWSELVKEYRGAVCLPGARGWIVVAIVAAVWIAAGVCHG